MSPSKDGFITLRASRTSGAAVYDLHVVASRRNKALSRDTHVAVLDGWEEPKGEGYGEVKLALPRGLYTVRLERGGAIREEIVRHTKPRKIELLEPQRQSAVPSFDTTYAHEYYSYTAHEHSLKDTDQAAPIFDAAGDRPGRLFVFVRAASEEQYHGEDLSESLFLFDLGGTRVTDFGPTTTVQDRKQGWMALSISAPAGSYRLHFSGLRPREMILSVFPGWETQLFVPFEKRPRLSQASVLLAKRGKGFHPDDRTAQVVDAALRGLQSGIDVLPPDDSELLLHGKFENPLLGLIGAHLLLLQKHPKWEVLEMVVGNLGMLLQGSADVQALRLAVALGQDKKMPVDRVTQPPMLRRGLDVVLQAAASSADLLPEGSLVERVAPYLLADSPWTMWSMPTVVAGNLVQDPLQIVTQVAAEQLEQAVKKSGDKLSTMPLGEMSSLMKAALPGVLARVGPNAQQGLQRGLNQISSAITEQMFEAAREKGDSAVRKTANQAMLEGVDAAMRAETQQTSLPSAGDELPLWVRNIVNEAKTRGREKDLEAIARQARLPVRLLRRLISQAGVVLPSPGDEPANEFAARAKAAWARLIHKV